MEDGWDLRRFFIGYSAWLLDELGLKGHEILFGVLYDEEFTWFIDNDENRASDGVYMRDRYSYETGNPLPDGWDSHPCSFLEMLASMAFTMEESFLYDPDDDTGADRWMREMLENCGLWKYSDESMMDEDGENMFLRKFAEADIRTIAHDVMERRIGYSGEGGLFPLWNPKTDQRKVELWVQLNSYVTEKMG